MTTTRFGMTPLHVQIRTARLKARMSIAELARLAGVNRTWLQKFEHDGKNITVDSLRRIISQLPQAQFAIHDGLILDSTAAEAAGMDRLLRKFTRASETHALRVRAAADALDAMATTAEELAALAAELDALWGKCRERDGTAADRAGVALAEDARNSGEDGTWDDETSGQEVQIRFPPVMVLTVAYPGLRSRRN